MLLFEHAQFGGGEAGGGELTHYNHTLLSRNISTSMISCYILSK